MGDKTSKTGNRIDAGLARGYARQALRENRLRSDFEPGTVRGSIATRASRQKMIEAVQKRFKPTLLGTRVNSERTAAALGFHDAGRLGDGTHTAAIMFAQQDLLLDPKRKDRDGKAAGFEAVSTIVAIAVPHLLERFVMRAGLKGHDELVAAVRPVLGWALIAAYVGRPGPFSIPVPDGLIGCEWQSILTRNTDGRVGGGTLIKTFIGIEAMKSETAAMWEALIAAGATGIAPRFPRVSAFTDEEVATFERIHAIGAAWQRRKEERAVRRPETGVDPEAA